jgi:hypothetical protein
MTETMNTFASDRIGIGGRLEENVVVAFVENVADRFASVDSLCEQFSFLGFGLLAGNALFVLQMEGSRVRF